MAGIIHTCIGKLEKFIRGDGYIIEYFRKFGITDFFSLLKPITHCADKQTVYNSYSYDNADNIYIRNECSGDDFNRLKEIIKKYNLTAIITKNKNINPIITAGHDKIHYGCGNTIIDGWLNVDLYFNNDIENYRRINLTDRHPFADNTFRFAFSEDFIEHLNQDDSIIFLYEVYRTLKPGGVVRLSFPGLEGVLKKHYSNERYFNGTIEAYLIWDHLHFYSREELFTVAKHIGFTRMEIVDYGQSHYEELRHLDTRKDQIGLNTYVELTK